MLHETNETETVQNFVETQSQEVSRSTANHGVVPQARTIRYMDDSVFQRSLDEVVSVHGRLLAKLAE